MHVLRARDVVVALVLSFAATPAFADTATPTPTPAPAAPAPSPGLFDDVYAYGGLNLRTDLGVHPLRLEGGFRAGLIDAVLVVDPLIFMDGQSSTDLLLQARADIGVAGFAGWRTTTLDVTTGTQFQQNLLLGFGLDLPQFFGGAVRGQWGVELALMLVKHGGGLPDEVISFESGRHYIDLVNFAMFARIDLGWSP